MAEAKAYDQIDAAPEERRAASPSTPPTSNTRRPGRHYAHVDCPGPRRLRQEHDHRCRPDGRRHFLVCSAADGPMPQTREHILLARQVGVPFIIVYLNKATWLTTPNCSSWSRWKSANSSKYDFRATTSPSSGLGPQGLEGDQSEIGEPSIFALADATRQLHPDARARHRQALPRSRSKTSSRSRSHRRHRSRRARCRQGRRRN